MTEHNTINTSRTDVLRFHTIYAPPNYTDCTVHETKAEAMAYEAEHHYRRPEHSPRRESSEARHQQ